MLGTYANVYYKVGIGREYYRFIVFVYNNNHAFNIRFDAQATASISMHWKIL